MAKVAILDCKTYDTDRIKEAIGRGVDLLGGWGPLLGQIKKPQGEPVTVLLKINLLSARPADSPVITHPELTRALVRILKEQGCRVWIGDSAGGAIKGAAPTAKAFKISGYEEMARQEGAEIKNFDKEGVVAVKPRSGITETMYLAKPLFDADLVINLPKMKTHSMTMYTGAVKNLYGCIPGLKKGEYHRLAPNPKDFGRVIADVHLAAKASLHIMDGITAMEGEGPASGNPYPAGKILVSTDPLALDVTALWMMDMKLSKVPVLQAAMDLGLGEWQKERIEILGDYSKPPALHGFRKPPNFGGARNGAYLAAAAASKFMRAKPTVDLKTCKHCDMCVDSCPAGAIHRDTKAIDYSKCIECMCCHELCPYRALKLTKTNPLFRLLRK